MKQGIHAMAIAIAVSFTGPAQAKELMGQVWSVEKIGDVAPLVESMAKPA